MQPDSPQSAHFAFLASRHGAEHGDLRRAIPELGRELGLSIWVAEKHPEIVPRSGVDQLGTVDACMAAISRSQILIAVIDGSLGTSLDPYGARLAASYIEMELFQAALLGKPVHVFSIDRIADDSPAGRLLRLLKFAYPETTRIDVNSGAQVLSEVRRLLSRAKGQRWLPTIHRQRGRRLVGGLGDQRHLDWGNRRLWQELKFLDGTLASGRAGVDLDAIDGLLNEAELSVGSERKIARAWMAIRELMSVPYFETTDPRTLALWDRALSRWAAWSAWYGMHAHLFLGHPAALGSLSEVRSRLAATGAKPGDGDGHTASLNGAFASCYYSLSKIAPRAHGRSYLERAELYVEEGLARQEPNRTDGLHSLRGSIALQRGDAGAAIRHYETVMAMRERMAASEASVGEARAELGWAQVRAGARAAGVANLREGVRAMTRGHPPGFVVRGKKKLALGLASRFDLRGSFAELMEARDIATEHQLEGQLDLTLRVGSKIGDLLEEFGIRIARRPAGRDQA